MSVFLVICTIFEVLSSTMAVERTLALSLTDTDFFEDGNRREDLRQRLVRLYPSSSGSLDDLKLQPHANHFVTLEDGRREFRVHFDLSSFKTQDISVEISGPVVTVKAKHVDSTRTLWREFLRQMIVQSFADPMTITSQLSRDGILTLRAPVINVAVPLSTETMEQETTQD